MIRSIRTAIFSALMLAAPAAAMAKPVIHDHRDNGPYDGQNERVPASYGQGHGYGWAPTVHDFTRGSVRVGTDVVIRGARFTPGIRVFLGGEEMNAAITPTVIRFTVPGGTPDGALVLRIPGLARALSLGQIEVLGRWEHDGFRAWAPVEHEVAFYRPRIERLNQMLARAREQGREALIDRIKDERRAEFERHASVMDRLWAQYFARR